MSEQLTSPSNEQTPAINAREPLRICLLGSEGAGKTCFLAGLAVLAEPDRDGPLTVTPCDTAAAAYFDDLRRTFRQRKWPPPTTMTTLLTTRVLIDGRALEIRTLDYPGEDFRDALRKLDHDRVQELYDHYRRADALLLLFDPRRDLEKLADPQQRDNQVERQLALLQAVADAWAEQDVQHKVDVGIVITKCDSVPELTSGGSPKAYFQKRAGQLDQRIRDLADGLSYFAISAIGRSSAAPGEPEPRPGQELSPSGYAEIFEWVLRRKRSRKWAWLLRWGRCVAAVIVVLVLAMLGWSAIEQGRSDAALVVLDDDTRTVADRLESTHELTEEDGVRRKVELVQRELRGLYERQNAATTETELDDVLGELERLRELSPVRIQNDIDEARDEALQRKQDLLFNRVNDTFDNRRQVEDLERFRSLSQRFLSEYPGARSRCDEVREWQQKVRDDQRRAARQRIHGMPVTNVASLRTKTDAVFAFLEEFEADLDEREREHMRRAAGLAKQFSEQNFYSATLKRSGGFSDSRKQYVQLYIGDGLVKEYKSSGESRNVTWSADVVRLQWSSGQPVRVVLLGKPWGWFRSMQNVANLTDDGPLALRILGGHKELTQFENDWQEYCPEAFIDFEIEGISADDWEALDLYILPGDAW